MSRQGQYVYSMLFQPPVSCVFYDQAKTVVFGTMLIEGKPRFNWPERSTWVRWWGPGANPRCSFMPLGKFSKVYSKGWGAR